MDSYGDGNTYRGQICKDPEIKTIEINRYNADVERLVKAARAVLHYMGITFCYEGDWTPLMRAEFDKLRAALEPFNK